MADHVLEMADSGYLVFINLRILLFKIRLRKNAASNFKDTRRPSSVFLVVMCRGTPCMLKNILIN